MKQNVNTLKLNSMKQKFHYIKVIKLNERKCMYIKIIKLNEIKSMYMKLLSSMK